MPVTVSDLNSNHQTSLSMRADTNQVFNRALFDMFNLIIGIIIPLIFIYKLKQFRKIT
jgi:hypothetical protein